MTVRPPPIPDHAKAPPPRSQVAVALSAFMFPGAGQFAQRRWAAAILFSSVFLYAFVDILIRTIMLMIRAGRAASGFMMGNAPVEFPDANPIHFVIPLVIAIVCYVAGLLDTVAAQRRERRARNLARLARATGVGTLLLCLTAGTTPATSATVALLIHALSV